MKVSFPCGIDASPIFKSMERGAEVWRRQRFNGQQVSAKAEKMLRAARSNQIQTNRGSVNIIA